jgi:hypothetical protein
MVKRKSVVTLTDLQISRIGQQLLFALFVALTSSYIFSFFISSYFQINLTESLIFKVNDGWCELPNQGVGLHCFGDFYASMQSSFESPWKDSVTAYPPLSVIIFQFFQSLYLLSGSSNTALFLYLSLLIFSMAFPVLHLFFTKRIKSKKLCLILLLTLFSLAPTIMVIDRGNNIGFALPLIYMTYMYVLRGKDMSILITTTILCLWKPQLGIFALYFIFYGKYFWFIRWIVLTLLGYLFSFSFFGITNIFDNFRFFLKNLFGYQTYVSLPSYFPSNWSFTNFVLTIIDLPRLIHSSSTLNTGIVSKLTGNTISLISGVFLVISLSMIFYHRRKSSKLEILTLLSMLSFLTPSVSFSYYLSVLLPSMIFIAYGFILHSKIDVNTFGVEKIEIRNYLDALFRSKKSIYIFIGAMVTCFVSWPFTWMMTGEDPSIPASKIGIVWTLGLIIMNIWYLSLLFRRKQI